MLANLVIDVDNLSIEVVELVTADVRSQVRICLFLLLECFSPSPFSLLFPCLLFGLVDSSEILRLFLLLGDQVLDDLFDAWLVSGLLDLQPVLHYSILQLHCKQPTSVLFAIVVDLLSSLMILVELLMTVRILNDVVQSRLLHTRLHQDSLLVLQSIVESRILLPKIFNLVDTNVIDGNSILTSGIRIDAIIKQERIVVHNAPSVQSFNEELLSLEALHIVVDFDHSALDNVHLRGVGIQLIKVRSFLKLLLLHVENPFVFRIFIGSKILDVTREIFEEVNLVQTDLQEHFEWIIVLANMFPHYLIQ